MGFIWSWLYYVYWYADLWIYNSDFGNDVISFRVVRKQACRSLHCYLTFALTIKHFRNKQTMDSILDSGNFRLTQPLLVSFYITSSAVLLPPLTPASKIMFISSAWHVVNEEWERACNDMAHVSQCAVFPKSTFPSCSLSCDYQGELSMGENTSDLLFWNTGFIAAGLQKLWTLFLMSTVSCRGLQL